MRPPAHLARVRAPWLAWALAATALAGPAAPAAAQALTIPEYRELILATEGRIGRLDRELAAANARLDRAVAERDAAGSPRAERSRELSADIVRLSRRVADLEREKRAAEADLRELRDALDARYTTAIEVNLAQLAGLEEQDPRVGALLIETGRHVNARDSLRLQIRIQETVRNFREYPIEPADGPAEIREKAGFYRDYVTEVQARIAEIDRAVNDIRERERVRQRMQELLEDLAFLGEDVPDRPGDAGGGDLREDPALGGGAAAALAKPPAEQIRELEEERRQLELLRRRFEANVRLYEERARTVYSRQAPPVEEEPR